MSIWDFRPRGDVLTGVAIGVGVLAAPVVLPFAWSAVRPLLKAILKSGFLVYETGRGVFAGAVGGADREEPAKSKAAKVESVNLAEEKEDRISPVQALKVEDFSPLKKEKDRQPSAREKPKRKAKTTKKKPGDVN